jgi:gamma-glutamylaminecyclotransferase
MTTTVGVFVYGTLMKGRANHAVLARLGARFIAAAETVEPRVLVDLGPYPAMLASPTRPRAATRVSGELWEVDETKLAELDAFEGCPTLFRRERVALVLGERDGPQVEAFVYVYAKRKPAGARVLVSGRYEPRGR